MWTDIIFPYAHASDALRTEFSEFTLDGEPVAIADVMDSETNSISLFQREKPWQKITCQVTVSDPSQELADSLPDDCVIEDSVSCWILVRNNHSRLRIAEQLKPQNGSWAGTISLSKADLRSETTISATCVLSTELEQAPGLAFNKGESIATSRTWRLYVDEPTVMPGGNISSEWVNFSESPNTQLQSKSDCIWHISYDERDPKLLLNEAIPGLKQVLSLRGRTGIGHRIRDTLIHSLNQGIMMELCTLGLAELDPAENEQPADWRLNLLDYVAGAHQGEESDKVIRRWLNEWHLNNAKSEVLSELSTCIQRTLKISHSTQYIAKIHEERNHHDD